MSDILVIKRSGDKENFNIKKVERVLKWAVRGIDGVDLNKILDNFQFNYTTNGITTRQIHEGLIESSLNLISEDTPNYQFVAGKLLNYWLRKNVWGGKNAPRLIDLIRANIDRGLYSKDILSAYSVRDINKINEFLNHDRDFLIPHCGVKQFIDKYLVQDRATKEVFETPQFAYVLVAMTLFSKEKKDRLKWVKRAYNAYSENFSVNLATPVNAGARTPLKSYASCALFSVDDSLDSICAHDYLIKKASASRYGLGIDISAIRPIGSKIRNGDVLSTGLVPYLKSFESGIKSVTQNGMRGASATMAIHFWHYQIEDVIVLKNNALQEEKAVRFLDYSVGINNLFLERAKNNEDITLFSPHETPELLEKFGSKEWAALYEERERNCEGLMVKKISARKLLGIIAKERLETGRIYILNVDNVNDYGPYKELVQQSNLCQEVLVPTIPSQKWNDENGLIGVCILSAINPYNLKNDDELKESCAVAVRMLDNLIDYQEYFDIAAENFAKKYRSLGIGVINLAAWLARQGIRYEDDAAPQVVADLIEKISYYCIDASIDLAKERGVFEYFDKTKWADGELPIDRYCPTVDEFVEKHKLDWEGLRGKLKKYGIRNSTLLSFMPSETSSTISGSTSGLEPIRSLITTKSSKSGRFLLVAPDVDKYKEFYTLAFDMKNNDALLKVYAAVNKFTCMGISANTYVNVNHYENGQIPLSVIAQSIIKASRYGLKTLYYNNTEDGVDESKDIDFGCSSGACTI